MIKIHHIEARRSERIVWLLEELGVPYELSFKPGDVMGSLAMMKEVHPCAMAPTVEIGNEVLIESGAILETLMNRHGDAGLRPPVSASEHARYLEWLHFAEGSFMPRLVSEAIQSRIAKSGDAAAGARPPGATVKNLKYTDETLAKSPYLAGEAFSAADIMMHLPIRMGLSIAADEMGVPSVMMQPSDTAYAPYPHLRPYIQRLEARPAFTRMMAATMPLGWPAV